MRWHKFVAVALKLLLGYSNVVSALLNDAIFASARGAHVDGSASRRLHSGSDSGLDGKPSPDIAPLDTRTHETWLPSFEDTFPNVADLLSWVKGFVVLTIFIVLSAVVLERLLLGTASLDPPMLYAGRNLTNLRYRHA